MPRLAITIGKGAIGFPAAKQHVWAGTWDSPLLDIARLRLLSARDQGGWLGTPGVTLVFKPLEAAHNPPRANSMLTAPRSPVQGLSSPMGNLDGTTGFTIREEP